MTRARRHRARDHRRRADHCPGMVGSPATPSRPAHPETTLGSFEAWAALVAGAVEWLTGMNPVTLIEELQGRGPAPGCRTTGHRGIARPLRRPGVDGPGGGRSGDEPGRASSGLSPDCGPQSSPLRATGRRRTRSASGCAGAKTRFSAISSSWVGWIARALRAGRCGGCRGLRGMFPTSRGKVAANEFTMENLSIAMTSSGRGAVSPAIPASPAARGEEFDL